ncbi:hypothetical protein HKX23_17720 [Sulfitobacter sp. KE29]|uniref:hypothetical protein n=1 Tax=unclassified Sulfitobacter TaxID=196795 RepID=UPI0023E210B0|nr:MULTISPECIES: hypothetical protein [unclassified Sulfitobacter]MDF3420191.1 hypothetical protein [Sulfitobacter sp. Ks38]MDF3427676.1 hypothetical protein [Sulfitobacter sp. KE29]MDF3431255.1 hypothetical protein [Sulfitobacter sp. S46]MDF3446028.1 hypothetical protein [Sulfitobacter sp. KE31]MDF3550036.1 hypothetical protein [Sulfitobacter sp. KE28]
MSNGYKNGAFALGLVVGGGIVINLVLWLAYFGRRDSGIASQNQKEPLERLEGLLETFVTWSSPLTDWLTLVVSTLGTIVLVLTLLATNRTSVAALKAAREASAANKLIQDEQRPWVSLDREAQCEFSDRKGISGQLCWNYNLQNKGKSPAYDITTYLQIGKRDRLLGILTGFDDFVESCLIKRRSPDFPILFPGEDTNLLRYHSRMIDRYHQVIEEPQADGEEHFVVFFCVTYKKTMDGSSELGCEARTFFVQEDASIYGPWRHTMLEYSQKRVVR